MGNHEDDETPSRPSMASSNSIFDIKVQNIALSIFRAIDGPVTYFREQIVEPLQAKNTEKWYHRRFNRVPTVDQCDLEDPVCIYEADQQYFRDKRVDSGIVKILRNRKIECIFWNGHDYAYKCKKVTDDYNEAAANWFIKYGDIRTHRGSIEAYMKQKHRMLFTRKNPDIDLY